MIKKVGVAAAAVMLLAGCAGSDDQAEAVSSTTSKTVTKSASSTADAGEAKAWAKTIKTFEDENALPTSDWYEHVTKREVKSGSLWIHTDLVNDSDAAAIGNRMCGAYSIITLDNEELHTVFVRASDGQRITKCGAGAGSS